MAAEALAAVPLINAVIQQDSPIDYAMYGIDQHKTVLTARR
jgi:hypothetical protein